MSSAAAVNSQGPCAIQQADNWACQRVGGDGRCSGGAGGRGGPQWNGQSGGSKGGRYLPLLLLLLLHPPTHPSIFFLSSAHALQKGRIPVRIAVPIVMSRYDQIDVGYCNTYVGIGEEEAYKMKRDGRSVEGMDPAHPSHKSITFPMQPYLTRSSYLPSRVQDSSSPYKYMSPPTNTDYIPHLKITILFHHKRVLNTAGNPQTQHTRLIPRDCPDTQ